MTGSRDREAVLGRVRKALGKSASDPAALAEAQAYIDARSRGPIPAFDGDRVSRFIGRAGDMESTVARIGRREEIPAAIADYLGSLKLAPALVPQQSPRGVCWPELADLGWSQAGLSIEARPTTGDDRLGITGVYCAIAETGTLVFVTGADTPTATTLLPDTHVAVVPAERIVDTMEDAFALIRRELGQLPRAINMISGPSRTGDIEQTIVLGAHGPFRVHILVMNASDVPGGTA